MAPLAALIARQREGWTLDRDFYLDQEIAAAERDAIWHRRWLFIASGCEIAERGAFVTAQIGGEPIVVLRGHDDQVRAFANVCRHRGSRVCPAETLRRQLWR